ncbi:hypothetical protein AABC73_25315 [Pseudomonas sp. G.S.17]|uniref:hypothetical protein n=1 Tax=Pseudomonas sp. G.S.17 TaxID=3137451 RepID=UPI00311CC10C
MINRNNHCFALAPSARKSTLQHGLLVSSLFTLIPIDVVWAEQTQIADSTLTLGTVNVSSSASGPLSTTSVLSSVDILGGVAADRKLTRSVFNQRRQLARPWLPEEYASRD